MTILTERDSEFIIDAQLTLKGWVLNPKDNKRTVYKQKPKTGEEQNLLGRLKPDYMLYDSSNSSRCVVVIEAKRPNKNMNKALEQAKNYAALLNSPIAIATDGYVLKSWHLDNNSPLFLNDREIDELFSPEVSKRYAKDSHRSIFSTKDVSHRDLIKKFKKADGTLRGEGISQGITRFLEFANFMFMKMRFQSKGEDYRIGGHSWEDIVSFRGENLKSAFFKILGLLNKEIPMFFNSSIEKTTTLESLMDILSDIEVVGVKDDIRGMAFEHFIHSYTKGAKNDLGQYFTPRHIIKAIVAQINPQLGQKIYDPFCGTGGMLIECFRYLKDAVRNEDDLNLLRKETLYGCDNSDVAKVAMMNMIMFGDGHSNILRSDSYSRNDVTKGKYDVVITNIPFAQETSFVANYPVLPATQNSSGDSIGVQHCLEALKPHPNSIAGIIVPIGFLYKAELQKEREYISNNYQLEKVVDLPSKCFQPYTEKHTAILFIRGKRSEKKTFFYRKIENDGFSQNAYRVPMAGINDLDMLDDVKQNKEIKLGLDKYKFKTIEILKKNDEMLLGEVAYVKQGNSFAPNTNMRIVLGGKFPLFMVKDLAERHCNSYLMESSFKLNNEGISIASPHIFPVGTTTFPIVGKATLKNHRGLLAVEGYLINHLVGIYPKDNFPYEVIFNFFLNFDVSRIVYDEGYPTLRPDLIKQIPIPNYTSTQMDDIVAHLTNLKQNEKNIYELSRKNPASRKL